MADPTGVDIDLTLGVILVGLIVTAGLLGVTTAQSGSYFVHFPQDRRALKILVIAVWLLDVTHLGLYLSTMYTYLVKKEGLHFGQKPLPWTANAQLLVNACGISLIQSFYASRIWQLSRMRLLLVIMGLFIATTWLLSFVLFVKTITTNTVAEYVHLEPYDITMSAMTASTDVLLCGALVVLLTMFRKDTQGADRLINRLLIFTVNTGLLTSVHAIMSVIMVVSLPQTSLFVMFYYIGTRLYSVSLLATLNARIELRMQAERMGDRSLPEIPVTAPPLGLTNRKSSQAQATVLRRGDKSDILVTMPCKSETATITTGDGSNPTTLNPAPPRIFCEGNRCYVVPDGEFKSFWTPDFLADSAPVLALST
ncbi:hypothetical protein BD309DRAFT_945506 [Dichomitus squalens]|uniref:Uncharacterized protein n=1 Tax=Dichomitus squalens TaxID=114155 RepID=A0A4Q9Q674_9APHY|nr:uncharacterized protein DICSQDRAFT_178345 [Dichomitus squalens LYAD-421 SS1]EJF64748.1 hypothetical protein DICSQDRAFT_178345 [Dichomitus squalens LYAD-421 SS1]TBU50409.1 hypothetical protein BD309DRAFT_945506 [Dichomitus squalens]TBU62947.1 hypothetical protein BD310DRAFT_917476 [Dichomitus squalens]